MDAFLQHLADRCVGVLDAVVSRILESFCEFQRRFHTLHTVVWFSSFVENLEPVLLLRCHSMSAECFMTSLSESITQHEL